MSQYAPFFYEHIYRGDLVMLDDIADTSQLKDTYHQLVFHLNSKPFAYRQSVVLLFIPRDFSLPLRPQDYELYNDIHTYLHLLRYLSNDFKVYTFYVDRTGELEQNDAVYQQLRTVNRSLQANRPELTSHFLSPFDSDLPQEGDYKEYLRRQIAKLSDSTRPFYLDMLDRVADIHATSTMFHNALNHYIGEAVACLSEVNHLYAPIYRLDLSKEIEEWLKIVYYIKDMVEQKLAPEDMPAYKDYAFTRYDHVRRLLATYCKRLSAWSHSTPPIPQQGTYTHWEFRCSGNAAVEYQGKIDTLIEQSLKSVRIDSLRTQNVVDRVFSQLSAIVTDAWSSLQDFTAKQSRILLDPNSYQPGSQEPFDLDSTGQEDAQEEAQLLEQTNQHSRDAAQIPDFSAENRLEQELELINNQINQILENLNNYRFSTFMASFLFAILAVAGLYIGAQYSIFIKENTWWILGLYLLFSGAVFCTAYLTVRRKYQKEIKALLGDCKDKVLHFLRAFQQIAADFEQNIIATGRYSCLKRQLDEKKAAREAYHLSMQKYAWHKTKVEQILRNFTFFNGFINHAPAYEESSITLDTYDHAPEHTEFYLMKVFRR